MRYKSELESKLIDLGFRLEYKTYGGKHSEYVKEYCYKGKINCSIGSGDKEITTNVLLNAKRNKVNLVSIEYDIDDKNVSVEVARDLCLYAMECENTILRLVNDEDDLSVDEVVEVVEATSDEEDSWVSHTWRTSW